MQSISLGNYTLYDLIRFPAGEIHVRLREDMIDNLPKDSICIIARIVNMEQIIELSLLREALSDVCSNVKIFFPYLPFSRADRRFKQGDCFALKVFADFFKNDEVFTLDVHSKKALSEFNHLINIEPDYFIDEAIYDFQRNNSSDINLLLPDKGSVDRYNLPKSINILVCDKQRDPVTGRLSNFIVPDECEFKARPTLIIDDICDGGGTFIGIAEKIKKFEHPHPVGLYVTHGIFSKGLGVLEPFFSHIYTTDSFLQLSKSEKLTIFYMPYDIINRQLEKIR